MIELSLSVQTRILIDFKQNRFFLLIEHDIEAKKLKEGVRVGAFTLIGGVLHGRQRCNDGLHHNFTDSVH